MFDLLWYERVIVSRHHSEGSVSGIPLELVVLPAFMVLLWLIYVIVSAWGPNAVLGRASSLPRPRPGLQPCGGYG